MTNVNSNQLCFKVISNFTLELVNLYSKQQRSLKLYGRLIDKTSHTHSQSIEKHINAFRTFCISNRDAIITKSVQKIVLDTITYSDRVFINISHIFRLSDEDTQDVIWEHLLCISALVDPLSKAKEVLSKRVSVDKNGDDLLTDIFEKIEQSIEPNSSPIQALSGIMKSGVFTDVVTILKGISSNGPDVGKVIGLVQNVIVKLKDKTKGDPESEKIITMIDGLIGNIGNTNGTPPDFSGIMQEMMTSMGKTEGTSPDLAGMMQKLTSVMGNSDSNTTPPDLGQLMSCMGGAEGVPPDLMGMMQGLMGSMGGAEGMPPDLMGIMQGLMGSMGGAEGIPPDLMSMMQGLMGSMGEIPEQQYMTTSIEE